MLGVGRRVSRRSRHGAGSGRVVSGWGEVREGGDWGGGAARVSSRSVAGHLERHRSPLQVTPAAARRRSQSPIVLLTVSDPRAVRQ